MSANVGRFDRAVRMAAGLALLIAAYEALTGAGMWLAVAAGAVLVGTAIVGLCPAYTLIGIDTCGDKLRRT